MTTFTWIAGNGDWASPGNWDLSSVPDAIDAGAVLPGYGTSNYTVTIAAGETEVVNAFTLGDPSSGFSPTLDISGTLSFAGASAHITYAQGTVVVEAGGLLDGAAAGLFFIGPTIDFLNHGTVAADAGAGTNLQILASTTNDGTMIASNGILSVGGIGVGNLSGSTLTGGTWIAQGPSAGTFNQIEFGGHQFDAVIAIDAANIVLDGGASQIQGFSGGTFQPIEQQLQSIAAGGTLQLLNDRGFATTNTITDAGFLKLQGGTLSTGGFIVAPGGTLKGFGVVAGDVSNNGSVISSAGVLDVTGSISTGGTLVVKPGSAMVVDGAGTSPVVDDGTLYDASRLLSIASLSGAGTLVVQNGATIELAGAATQQVMFSGSNATLRLDDFAGYTGTLSGFAQGDTLVLAGGTATAAFVAGGSLVVMNNASTIDTIALAGSYAGGAGFTVSNSGGNASIVNTSGAPMRQDFAFTILPVNDTAGLGATEDAAIANDLSAAAADWAQYLTGHTTVRIQLDIVTGTSGSELARGGATTDAPSGMTLDGRQLDTPSSLIAVNTGNYVQGLTSDITVTFLAANLGSIFVNPSPTPTPSGSVPAGKFDLVTVFRHELAHGFGFGGLTTTAGTIGTQETLFDHYIQNIGGTIVFTGPHAEAQYGVLLGTGTATPVPLTDLPGNGEDFAHFANSTLDVNATDLMSGLGLPPETQRDITPMDLAVLQDVGAPLTATPVCFARGTRIATVARGEVAVESLNVGDEVVTVWGRRRIIWIGRRRIDCRRHPDARKVWAVRIRAHAFGDGLPRRDLFVSPQHALYLDGVLIPARCLIDNNDVAQIPVAAIEYFHIELSQHDVVLAEGLPAESYLDCGDRVFFDDGTVIALHPDFADRVRESRGCAPVKLVGPEVEGARRRLVARAKASA